MMYSHTAYPVYDNRSRVLILGTFPSAKSREAGFYYAHPQNRFWRVLAALLEQPVPRENEEKKLFLLEHKIALWDTVQSCEVIGSSDSTIRQVQPTELSSVFSACAIRKIFLNGKTAEKFFLRYHNPVDCPCEAVTLPSTSPANAAWSFERLLEAWSAVAQALREE